MSAPLLEIDALGKSFLRRSLFPGRGDTNVYAVRGVNLSVGAGRTLGVVGESGSGKSTLLRMMLRLLRPTEGRVLLDGADIWSLRGRSLLGFRRRVQAIFQDPMASFNPRHSIGAILSAPLEVHGIGKRSERPEMIENVLFRVGLGSDLLRRYPHQLSGGQRQRVAIARAIILRPSVLLADEPTSALDVSVQAQVLNLFKKTRAELGLTCVFVSHNLGVIRYVSDEVAVMRQGRVVEMGSAEEVLTSPRHEYTRALLAAVPDVRVPAGAVHAQTGLEPGI